jgi:hypothetical protein
MARKMTANAHAIIVKFLTIDVGVSGEIRQHFAVARTRLDLSVGEIDAAFQDAGLYRASANSSKATMNSTYSSSSKRSCIIRIA